MSTATVNLKVIPKRMLTRREAANILAVARSKTDAATGAARAKATKWNGSPPIWSSEFWAGNPAVAIPDSGKQRR